MAVLVEGGKEGGREGGREGGVRTNMQQQLQCVRHRGVSGRSDSLLQELDDATTSLAGDT